MRWLELRTGYSVRKDHAASNGPDARLGDAESLLGALDGGGGGIWLTGGEVATRPDLTALITGARSRGFSRIGLESNGHIVSVLGAAAQLRGLGLTDATVAVHARDPGVHDWIVGANGAFRRAVAGARALVRAGIATRIVSVATRTNMGELTALARLAAAIGAGHRIRVAVERAPYDPHARMVVPRFSLLQSHVTSALRAATDARIEADIVGMPLCFLPTLLPQSADRLDIPRRGLLCAVAADAPAPMPVKGPPCGGCRLSVTCPGASAAYIARWGWDEFRPPGAAERPPDTDIVSLHVAATDESSRSLRQRLVHAATNRAVPATHLHLTGCASEHASLPILLREARRLGFDTIDVAGRGPIENDGSAPIE